MNTHDPAAHRSTAHRIVETAPSPDSPYWDPALETQSRAEWDAMKLALLKESLRHAYDNAPYYRRTFDEAGVRPDDVTSLDDLARFPTIEKSILRERQTAMPLLGDLAAVPEDDVVYVSASSGSTGVPTVSPFTAEDFDEWMDFEARLFWSSGLRRSDRYAHSLNFSLFVGGPCVLGAQKIGALSIHAGTVPSDRLLSILETFQATAMWTTPSYAWYLGETALKKGIDPKTDLAIRKIFVAGEPGGSIPETRARIEALWGADVYDYYGLSDVFGACAGMCEAKDGLHWAEDHIHVEVVDPETGKHVAPGERGEMVLTTLRKRARPLIRFRTGDIVSFTEETCTCGRTSQRLMGVHGRLDDMLVIRGVNIFPSDVEALIRKDHDFTGEYRLVVERDNHLDTLTVEAEKIHGFNGTDADLAARLQKAIKSTTGVGVTVTILGPEELPRETHKAKRVDDRRGAVWTA